MFGLLENVEKLNDFENELGKFTVYRYAKTSCEYWGEVDWRTPDGGKIKARVPCENEKECFAKLAEVLADAAVWERRLKEHALKYFLEEYGIDDGLIGIWGSVEELSGGGEITPVTQEEFLRRIKVCNIIVVDERSLLFGINSDNMFTDHILLIDADIGGNITECRLTW